MIDVTELLHDPDFATHFTIRRTTGQWKGGRFALNEPELIPCFHPAHPSTEKELAQIPEGDRLKEVITFFCVRPKKFHLTRSGPDASDEGGISDEILYKGNIYKLVAVKDWDSHGWMRGFGTLVGPEN